MVGTKPRLVIIPWRRARFDSFSHKAAQISLLPLPMSVHCGQSNSGKCWVEQLALAFARGAAELDEILDRRFAHRCSPGVRIEGDGIFCADHHTMYKAQGLDGTQIWVLHSLTKFVTASVPISPRMLRITFCTEGRTVHIISAHAPTECAHLGGQGCFLVSAAFSFGSFVACHLSHPHRRQCNSWIHRVRQHWCCCSSPGF